MNCSIQDIRALLAIRETGSQSAAARRLGLTAAAVSAVVQRMETTLGVRLFERSSRVTTVTAAGEAFLSAAMRAVDLLEEAGSRVQAQQKRMAGVVLLAAPSDLVRTELGRCLQAFRDRHPEVVLSVHVSDALHHLQADALDLALRYGDLSSSSLVATRLCQTTRITCAAPAYLQRRGTPQQPEDLKDHECLCFWTGGRLDSRWRYRNGTDWQEVAVKGHWRSDDSALVRQWALQGLGLINKSDLDLQDDLGAGRLTQVLGRYSGPPVPLQLVWGSAGPSNRRTRAVADFLIEWFRGVGARTEP